jgi:hypothetical protein
MAKKAFDTENEPLLQEIRENHASDRLAFNDIQDEGKKDVRYIAGDPWDDTEKRERKESGRPLIALDELNQYVNQLINNVRESKRGITVVPRGAGANDELARIRQGIFREIEYKSRAQAAYVTAFEGCSQRGYGWFRLGAKYISDSSFDQELVIRRIPNPDTVLPDSSCKELDCSDAERFSVTDIISQKKFKRDYPNAKIVSFGRDAIKTAPDWIKGDLIQIGEYWKVKKKKLDLFLAQTGETPTVFAQGGMPDDSSVLALPEGAKVENQRIYLPGAGWVPLLKKRSAHERSVCQYITNGLEILDEIPWPGKWIPIIPMFGKEMYVDDGAGAKRELFSLIRLARDPYKLYCYYRSQECEEATLSPKVPWVGYEGQFEGHEKEWANAHKDPVGFLQGKISVEGAPIGTILPLPTRTPFTPNFLAYEQACEGARRAIQAAVGISPLPTSAQRLNDKSGKALEKIQQSADHGSFHFIDSYDMGLETAGRYGNQVMKFYYDTTGREVGIRGEDEEHSTVRLNIPYTEEGSDEQKHYQMDKGEFEVTLSTGPSEQSQRDAAGDFADTLASTPLFPQVADLIVKLKNLGPLGDQIAERLTPPQYAKGGAQQAAAAAQQAQQHLQAVNLYAQDLEKKVKELEDEKKGKIVDNEYRMSIEKLKIEAQVTIAEITTKAQEALVRAKLEADIYKQLHSDAHEAETQAQAAQAAAAEQAQQQPDAGAQPAA